MGRVGSGKSTLLAAIMGELHKVQGTVVVPNFGRGTLGLVEQEPWLQRGTLRSNILFGKAFDATRYYQALECCSLLEDIKVSTSRTPFAQFYQLVLAFQVD